LRSIALALTTNPDRGRPLPCAVVPGGCHEPGGYARSVQKPQPNCFDVKSVDSMLAITAGLVILSKGFKSPVELSPSFVKPLVVAYIF
jgi:hypothetical protein